MLPRDLPVATAHPYMCAGGWAQSAYCCCPQYALHPTNSCAGLDHASLTAVAGALQPKAVEKGEDVIQQARCKEGRATSSHACACMPWEGVPALEALPTYQPTFLQGDLGDRFYIVEAGELATFRDHGSSAVKAYGPGGWMSACVYMYLCACACVYTRV